MIPYILYYIETITNIWRIHKKNLLMEMYPHFKISPIITPLKEGGVLVFKCSKLSSDRPKEFYINVVMGPLVGVSMLNAKI